MNPISRRTIGVIAIVIIVGAGAGIGGYYLGYSPGYEQGRESMFLVRAHPEVTGTLSIFEWSGYETPELWDTFKVMYPNVELKFSFFVDESEALAKLMAGFEPDIMHPCGDNIRRWYDAGVIDPLDISLIPNWDGLFDDMKTYCENNTMINGEHYFVPVDWGFSTVIYRPDLLEDLGIPRERWDSYNLLFDYDPRLEGKICLRDSPFPSFLMAAIAADVPIDHLWDMNDTEMEMAKAKLHEGKPLVHAYWETEAEIASLMAEGAVVAANGWGESAVTLTEEGYNATVSLPKKGRILWICGLAIAKGLKERKPDLWEAAHAFISAWLDPVAGAWLFDNYWIGSPSSKAPALVEDQETLNILGLGSTAVIKTSIQWHYLVNEQEWVEAWTEYRAA